jgi:hypothetical protein
LKPHTIKGDNIIMKSPSSPFLNTHNEGSHPSTSERAKANRNDTCPSPLDETETIMLLGSGEKLRVKELNTSRMEKYANSFNDTRKMFASTIVQQ